MNLNLIPTVPCAAPNYWCTWRTQATVSGNAALRGARSRTADFIDEDFLFGRVNALGKIDTDLRRELIAVLDDGWDIPYGLTPYGEGREKTRDYYRYGSMEMDGRRFPSCTGTPAERLAQMNERVRAMGYRGIGLWVCPQICCPDPEKANADAKEAEPYWAQRLRWCRDAGVLYWKIDWGLRAHDPEYREMMYEAALKHAPGLVIEQACTQSPFDLRFSARDTERYRQRCAEIRRYLAAGHVFRLYDTSSQFRHTTMIARCAEALRLGAEANSAAVPNAEDAVYVAAALGFTIGAMRHFPLESEKENRYYEKLGVSIRTPMNALRRALRWQRLAPPFAIRDSGYEVSVRMLTDSYQYPYVEGDPWPHMSEKLCVQDCPAAVCRNMPLPRVEAPYDEPPVAVASVHPRTHALGVYAAPRTIGGSVFNSIRADVTVEASDAGAPCGIFGHVRSLTVVFPEPVEGRAVLAQDLSCGEAADITEQAVLKGNRMTLSGELIDRIGLTRRDCDDELPGLTVALMKA